MNKFLSITPRFIIYEIFLVMSWFERAGIPVDLQRIVFKSLFISTKISLSCISIDSAIEN